MSVTPTSDRKPQLIPGNDLKSLATYMKSDRCRNVFLMVTFSLLLIAQIIHFLAVISAHSLVQVRLIFP